jgi:hypothetical protein
LYERPQKTKSDPKPPLRQCLQIGQFLDSGWLGCPGRTEIVGGYTDAHPRTVVGGGRTAVLGAQALNSR